MNKKLVLTYYDAEGNIVPSLSKDPATVDHLVAALHFIEPGCSLTVACDLLKVSE